MKLQDARKDHYRKLAHEQGFRSRAAFKLKELNQHLPNTLITIFFADHKKDDEN